MNWSELRERIEPTILVKEKPETLKIKIIANLTELVYMLACYDIGKGNQDPPRKELFETLNVSINTCIDEIYNRFENSFDSLEDMIEGLILMIYSKGKINGDDVMNCMISVAYFRDLLKPDIESILIEFINYKLNCNKYGSKKFESN